jgi:drug/metabolite transporter (DMT)-like permease
MRAATSVIENRPLALGLRLFGISCLAIMTVLIKLASDSGVKLPEIMFWRQGVAVPVVLAWVLMGPGLPSLATQRFGAHVTRSALGLTSMALNFGAIILLPLAEATTLGFAVPIFATILSALILKEAVGIHRWAAVVTGFIGVLIVVQPGGSHIPLSGALVGLSSAIMISITSLQIRDMGRTEAAPTTVFWFSALSVIPLALLLPWFVTPHDGYQWLLLSGIGVLGGMGQIGLTGALRLAPVSTVMGMDYISLLWSTLFGWLIWSHVPGAATWIGAVIIIGSGVYIALREHRLSIASARETGA